ncbi:MAG TPA: hypothetical protein VK468_04995, partial [Pyrinomonadaceae bacterium]|nr:hypothetical protein [Pyrinomonadaceae bacterium]
FDKSENDAFRLIGVDVGSARANENITPNNYQPLISNWYRGRFENRLYDLTVVRRDVDDISGAIYISNVIVKIYLPDEIISSAENFVNEARDGRANKSEAERIKDKLETISFEAIEFNRAQQLSKNIDKILLYPSN